MFVLFAATVVGSILQRVSGIGFALVVAPFFMLAVGVSEGIVLVQLCGAGSAAIVLTRTLKDVNWGLLGTLLPLSVVGVAAGTFLRSVTPNQWTLIVSALIMLASLLVSVRVGTRSQVPLSQPLVHGTGLVAGLMTSIAGVGGTALVAFGRLTRWDQREFAATLQPYFIVLSSFTAAYLVWSDPASAPSLTAVQWVVLALCLAGGVGVGSLLAAMIDSRRAGTLTLWVAFFGALFALFSGVQELISS